MSLSEIEIISTRGLRRTSESSNAGRSNQHIARMRVQARLAW